MPSSHSAYEVIGSVSGFEVAGAHDNRIVRVEPIILDGDRGSRVAGERRLRASSFVPVVLLGGVIAYLATARAIAIHVAVSEIANRSGTDATSRVPLQK
jgi:hypothetical protein